MPTAALHPCPGGCGQRVAKGKCATCRRTAEQQRGTASQRGYDQAWQAFRRQFIGLLLEAGITPVCGAALPTGPKTSDSRCAEQGIWTYTSRDGSSLHFDHEPPLTDAERKVRTKVCDENRLQLLCSDCHHEKTGRMA